MNVIEMGKMTNKTLLKCKSCKRQNKPTSLYCQYCGVKLKNVCDNCNKEIDLNALFCNFCGNKIGSKSRLTDNKSIKKGIFKGRITRRFFFFGGFLNLTIMALISVDIDFLYSSIELQSIITFFWLLFFILAIIALSLVVRRLHDINKSGWYFVLLFIPLINFLFLLYLLFAQGDKKTNDYGPAPSSKSFGLNELREIYMGSLGYGENFL